MVSQECIVCDLQASTAKPSLRISAGRWLLLRLGYHGKSIRYKQIACLFESPFVCLNYLIRKQKLFQQALLHLPVAMLACALEL